MCRPQPECGQYIVYAAVPDYMQVYPPDHDWADSSKHVPSSFLADFEEARKVLDVSPNASAMLSRRCLQRLLNELPSYLAADLHAVREVGHFGAHPRKSENTGEIMDVEPGEATWTIEVLEGLFDFYFVAPQRAVQRREALNRKLQDAGRPPMRTAPVIMFPLRTANA